MRIKPLITVILLVFVAASVVTAIAKEVNRPEPVAAVTAGVETAEEGRAVVAYYFHNKIRCKSCKTIEAYAESTITEGFADEIEDGLLEFRPVDTDEPETAHYVKDYLLYTKHVVLVEFQDGEEVRWKDLDRVWELLSDEKAFRRYIMDEVQAFLDGAEDDSVVWVGADDSAGGTA